MLNKSLIKNDDKKNTEPSLDSKSSEKKVNKPPLPIKSRFFVKYPVNPPPPLKLPPLLKKRKSITKKPIIKTVNISKKQSYNNKILKNKAINRKGNLKMIEDMCNILSLIDKSKGGNFKFEDFLNNLDELDNQKLIIINNRLHKKIINNFHKIKLNQITKDKEITRKIIKETIQVLNECLVDLSLLES